MIKTAIIRKLPSGEYRLYSKTKGSNGKRRNLGTFDSLDAAEKHEREVQFFKQQSDDGKSSGEDMAGELSDIASFLEKAGFTDKADKVYVMMNALDGSFDDGQDADDFTSGHRIQPVNMLGGESPISGGFGGMAADHGQPADDVEQDNVDMAAHSNGLSGNSPVHNQNSGMFQGMNYDSAFTGGISYRNLEGPYGG